MARCTNCPSTDADPDIGLCFTCFCEMQGPEPPPPTDAEYCAAYGHLEYENSGRCYCGEWIKERDGEQPPIQEGK